MKAICSLVGFTRLFLPDNHDMIVLATGFGIEATLVILLGLFMSKKFL